MVGEYAYGGTSGCAEQQSSMSPASMKASFREWLNDGNAKMFSPDSIISCLDNVSQFAIKSGRVTTDFWSISQHSVFNKIYKRLLSVNLFRAIDGKANKVFPMAGSLYLKFLNELPSIHKSTLASDNSEERSRPISLSETTPAKEVNPKDFVDWLMTQTNANGSLFLRNVAKRYASNLISAPSKLIISLSQKDRNVFNHLTIKEFDRLDGIFRSAPNYREVNRNSDHGAFSAGLGAYRRYLNYLEQTSVNVPLVDFSNLKACSGTDPISCTINGITIPFIGNWRDLLVAITEHLISKFRDKMETLKHRWFSNYSDSPYLLMSKPPLSGKELSNGYWINVHYGIPQIVGIIAGLCRYCDIDLKDVVIACKQKRNSEPDNSQDNQIIRDENCVPESILSVLREDYANGFRFDTTALRLLSSKAGVEIDDTLQSALKHLLFHRGDDVYFILDVIANEKTRSALIDFTNSLLDEYGFFEISELYYLYADKLNSRCIGNAGDFETFYEFINNRNDIRCVAVPQIGNKIVRLKSENAWGTLGSFARRITEYVHNESGGAVTEEELHKHFCVFSVDLLAKIIKNCAEELMRTEINGIVVYQTLDALGLTDDFSDVLAETLNHLAALDISASDDNLHTALSLSMGFNFRLEYSIPDQSTYRRLIAAYYKAEPPREWKGGAFSEVSA